MFGLISGLYNTLHEEAKISVLLVGCDEAGKTTLLERCKVTDLTIRKSSLKKRRSSLSESESSMVNSMAKTPEKKITVDEPPATVDDIERRGIFCPSPAYYRHNTVLAQQQSESSTNTANPADESGSPHGKMENGKHDNQTNNDQMDDNTFEIDLRQGKKMLPLHKIKPTVGMNLGKLKAFGSECSFWDLGGKEQMRPLWERYYDDADAVIFVVDITSSHSKLKEAKEAFHSLKRNEKLAGAPILVFLNKIDLLGKKNFNKNEHEYFYSTVHDLTDKLDLFPNNLQRDFTNYDGLIDLEGDHLIRLCHGSAKTGEGVKSALQWLITTTKSQMTQNE